jgi:hypothetical protein
MVLSYGDPVLRKVKLVGKTERAKKILKKYNNCMYLMEYDEYGKPLFIAPNGLQGIYVVSPDGFWQGWLILDSEAIFEEEYRFINNSIYDIIENYEKEKNDTKNIN